MKVAIITGASVGIGSATAEAFLAEGFTVFNLARRVCPIEGVTSIACDLADEASIDSSAGNLEQLVAGAAEVTLIHNASQMRKDQVDGTPELPMLWHYQVLSVSRLEPARSRWPDGSEGPEAPEAPEASHACLV